MTTPRSRRSMPAALLLTLALSAATLGQTALAEPRAGGSADPGAERTAAAPAAASNPERVGRVFGAERVATAAALAGRGFTAPVPVAYVATSGAFPDALTGGAAAGIEDGPLLLVHATALPPATVTALRALRPDRIVVLGGTEAVSPAVQAALEPLTAGSVERRSGPDRFATAAAISAAAHPDGASVAVVASGEDFADALAGGAAAAALGGPLLLVQRHAVPAVIAEELTRLSPERVVVLGGTAAISADVGRAVGAVSGGTVQRLAGRTRFETAEAIARTVFPGAGADGEAMLVTGTAFPDALAATPVAAAASAPILLTPPRILPDGVAATLRDLDPGEVTIAGGRAAVHENVEAMAREALGVAPDGYRQDDPLEPQDLYVSATQRDLDTLWADTFRDDRLPASLSRAPGGPAIGLHGIELRGSSSRLLPKKSFDIRANQGQPFLFGSTRMNANAGYTDPSMMRERLAFGAFTEVGHPAPRTRHFDLHLGGVYEGLYTHIERIDGDLLAHLGLNPDGTLVRDELRSLGQSDQSVPQRRSSFGLDLRTVANPQALLRRAFSDRSGTEADWSRLEALIRWVHDTPPGPAFAAGFAERFDVDNVLTWLAVQNIVGDMDGFGDDYWLYVDHTTPGSRWQVIPWDKDLTFGSHTRRVAPHPGTANDFFAYEYEIRSGFDNHLVALILGTSSLRQQLNARILALIDGPLRPAYFAERIATISSAIADNVNMTRRPGAFRRNPGQHHGAAGRHALHAENVRDFTELRSAFLRRRLQPSGGAAYRATVDLRGVAPGSRVLFTDATGFTIGALTVTANADAGRATLGVAAAPDVDGVRRRYVMDLDTGSFEGRLSLYYRNEIDSIQNAPAENWYVADQPVGGQTRLVLTVNGGRRASAVNPYSNKVTAPVQVGPGRTELRLVHGS